MQTTTFESAAPSAPATTRLWAGYLITALPVLFLLFDGFVKFTTIAPVLEANAHLGIPAGVVPGIGILELVCVALYVFPRTSLLGALLMTGYLGGATSMHVRIGDPFYFPLLIGGLLWLGLYLRDERVKLLLLTASERKATTAPITISAL
jgi:hypothetical protein